MAGGQDATAGGGDSFRISAPSVSLPKGGGAIRGMGEKFAANPVTGTGALTVPIFTSPSRSAFGPQLTLSYDSGSGNGPFGLGWQLSLPSITRKTDKGLPQYRDAEESDVFILSGAEDLVPELDEQGQPKTSLATAKYPDYLIKSYRPRIEGLFARIERWTDRKTGLSHWRSISRDNITSLYGRTPESRIADPVNEGHVFCWLICESYDDKGNAIVYGYARENSDGVSPADPCEGNRTPASRGANRYLSRIQYGNQVSLLVEPDLTNAKWLFEVVFDYLSRTDDQSVPLVTLTQYSDHYPPDREEREFSDAFLPGADPRKWGRRLDPFSAYRAGFEIRTYRLCHRVLMVHHFNQELGRKACLVRSTDFEYDETSVASYLTRVTQSGYVAQPGSQRYLKRSLPPLEFTYTKPQVSGTVRDVDPATLENLPQGADGSTYQWTDLDGEGLSGLLSEQGGAWYFKRNLSPTNLVKGDAELRAEPRFGGLERVAELPALSIAAGRAQFLDLAGDGQPDLVNLETPMPGFYERTADLGWAPFRSFTNIPTLDFRDPNVRFVDLDGDGHADILITENEAIAWHPALAESGFGPRRLVCQPADEEKGPRLVFADGTQTVYLADMSGDGLTDLVRIRNGEVCYWPHLGYGRFGTKVAMGNPPWFDLPDQFDQKRIRLADIDGSGSTDIIYLGRDQVALYFNQSGNGWSAARALASFPRVDPLAAIATVDLLGNGTACLVWSSPLAGHARRPMRYVDLMGGQKPHLLVKTVNNLGAETHVHYAPSTRFYVADRLAGRPWVSRLPFPVHVVERVETWDEISRNRFVTRYAYHHGYFDGEEREFRGFGMVERWDTEQLAALTTNGELPDAANIDAASHVPPVHTKTWHHTGIFLGRHRVSNFFAGLLDGRDVGEYYREPGLSDAAARDALLDDTMLPPGLSLEEEREACRALKGSMLRQEVYADDGSAAAAHPYTVVEQNFGLRCLQPRRGNRHAVFLAHPREAITYHFERNPVDPRVSHAITVEVNEYGNVLQSLAVAYARRERIRAAGAQGQFVDISNPALAALQPTDRGKQTQLLAAFTRARFTNAIDSADDHRTPLPSASTTFELTGASPAGHADRFTFEELTLNDFAFFNEATEIPYEQGADPAERQLRPIECLRTYYRKNRLDGLLDLHVLESRAIPGEALKLAFTPGLLAKVYRRTPDAPVAQSLLPAVVAEVLQIDSSGITPAAGAGGYVDRDANGHWWVPSGRTYLSPDPSQTPAEELDHATQHFFLPMRYRDPFHTDSVSTEHRITYDDHDLLVIETQDPLGNRVTVGERTASGGIDPAVHGNDYRVLQPALVTDPNGNRVQVVFDALGLVAATAVMGKRTEGKGDNLAGIVSDPVRSQLDAFMATPRLAGAPGGQALAAPMAYELLAQAGTRIVYDLDRYRRTRQRNPNDPGQWKPAVAVTITRETHDSDLAGSEQSKLQIGFGYSDGFGREVQRKAQAECGPLPRRGAGGDVLLDGSGQPLTVDGVARPRWVASGWTVFNNKGKPVRQYEPYFSDTHDFEFDLRVGVSPVLFYDPAERAIATLRPEGTYEKVVFGPWHQTTYDACDTVAPRDAQTGDPRSDPDIHALVAAYFRAREAPQAPTWRTWYQQRSGGDLGDHEQAAAAKAAAHADTPTTAHLDMLGRTFLTVARNRVVCIGHDLDGTEESFLTRVDLDIEGNQRAVLDERRLPVNHLPTGALEQRVVMRYAYDMLGNRIHQFSMEAGARWMLNDVAGKPVRAWDSRGHHFTTTYDPLRRPVAQIVRGTTAESDQRTLNRNLLVDKFVYGEPPANASREDQDRAVQLNLRTRLYRHFDSAGITINASLDASDRPTEAYDFKGNLLRSTRRLAARFKEIPDWSLNPPPPLDPEAFESSTLYDAFNRPIQSVAPHSSLARIQHPGRINVIQPAFNDANLLQRVDVWLGQNAEPAGLLDPAAASPVGVANIDYDARGQRTLIDYKTPDATVIRTTYTYDRKTFRLTHLYTRRGVDPKTAQGVAFGKDCDNPLPPPATIAAPEKPPHGKGCGLQNLHYIYDAVGNITHIHDDAQQTLYFRNQRVEPSNDYSYDALYRLIHATGREHLGQLANGDPMPPTAPDAANAFHSRLDHPGNGNAMGRYAEHYVYDAVGNFLQLQHRGSDPAHSRWTRAFDYAETSLIEDGVATTPRTTSNRLSHTTLNPDGANPLVEPYQHDQHGNMIRMPHLGIGLPKPNMYWDYKDRLYQVDLGGGGAAWYVCDASGQRMRKAIDRQDGTLQNERVYLGDFEIYREYKGPSTSPKLERESLHVMVDVQKIALVETLTIENRIPVHTSASVLRYQLGDHLGSTTVELAAGGALISYEEFYPHGSTSYQAQRTAAEVSRKRYRYSGKERDEETALSYYGARNLAPWIGRWISPDSLGIQDGLCTYEFAHNSPICTHDRNGESGERPDSLDGWRNVKGFGFSLQLKSGGERSQPPVNLKYTAPMPLASASDIKLLLSKPMPEPTSAGKSSDLAGLLGSDTSRLKEVYERITFLRSDEAPPRQENPPTATTPNSDEKVRPKDLLHPTFDQLKEWNRTGRIPDKAMIGGMTPNLLPSQSNDKKVPVFVDEFVSDFRREMATFKDIPEFLDRFSGNVVSEMTRLQEKIQPIAKAMGEGITRDFLPEMQRVGQKALNYAKEVMVHSFTYLIDYITPEPPVRGVDPLVSRQPDRPYDRM